MTTPLDTIRQKLEQIIVEHEEHAPAERKMYALAKDALTALAEAEQEVTYLTAPPTDDEITAVACVLYENRDKPFYNDDARAAITTFLQLRTQLEEPTV